MTRVAKNWSHASFTSEFGHELEAERQAWLRRRFIWYVAVGMVFGLVGLVSTLAQVDMLGRALFAFQLSVQVIGLIANIAALTYVWRNKVPRVPILRIVYWLILGTGTLVLLSGPMIVGGMSDSVRDAVRDGRSGAATMPLQGDPVTEEEKPTEAAPLEPGTDAGTSEEPTARGEKPTPAPRGSPVRERRAEAVATILNGMMGVWTIFVSHFFACVFLPWTARESLRPIIPLLAINAVITGGFAATEAMAGNWSWSIAGAGAALVLLSLLMPLPGIAVCWWRDSRFRQRFTFDTLRGRYSELKAELFNARQIHESLFPRPLNTGPVRFGYVYEPMRQIGGDYLHSFISRPTLVTDGGKAGLGDSYNFVLVDVTGHGIPAALTVNRLHGELERIFAENPETPPGEVLRLLNSYVHLTLATHSVYVTAICIRIRPTTDSLEYASGGHPPAFLKAVDGTLEQLDSTALVLGACAGADFRSEQRKMRFGPGDVLIAYTDGATEARDLQGRYFGIAGLQRAVATGHPDPEGGWPATILKHVESHRYGPTADDILLIEVRRPLNLGPDSKTRAATAVRVGAARR